MDRAGPAALRLTAVGGPPVPTGPPCGTRTGG
ncbi:hypothetical protein SSCG_00365 [Streptomyces clavuligerus]|nr:hypothetical protein SSCG_00365 [Streptomyces clavuligerus]